MLTIFNAKLVSRSQTFRVTAEGLESMAAFIGQGPPMNKHWTIVFLLTNINTD